MVPVEARSRWSWPRALTGAVLSAAVVGLPTDVLDNPLFGRMTPVRWWEYPVLALTALLTGLWAGIRTGDGNAPGSGRAIGGSFLSVLAVGCPVCNKIVVALLGTSGALGIWAPIQPVVAVLSLAGLTAAVAVRRRDCAAETCSPAGARGSAVPGSRQPDGQASVITAISAADAAPAGSSSAVNPASPHETSLRAGPRG